MGSVIKSVVKPRTLTEVVLNKSPIGAAKHLYWRHLINPIRSLRYLTGKPQLASGAQETLGTLRSDGIVSGPAEGILGTDGKANLQACEQIIRDLSQADNVKAATSAGHSDADGKKYLFQLVRFDQKHAPDSPFLKLALDTQLLGIVANYMGMWPQLHSIGAWLNFPTDNEASHSQLWHRDPEDLKTVKVFIYLDDVASENGPFSYIPTTHPFGANSDTVVAHDHKRRITDEEMAKSFPKESWVEYTGPAKSMIIADTVGFHRGGNTRKGQRLLITFTFTSGTPQKRRNLKVTGRPDWLSTVSQDYALR